MDDATSEKDNEREDNNLELSASLKELRFTAGGNWRQYLGPWIGPILLVAILGFTAFLIIVAIYSTKVVLPCITFPIPLSGNCSFWSLVCRSLHSLPL